jgi:hypothetical protein
MPSNTNAGHIITGQCNLVAQLQFIKQLHSIGNTICASCFLGADSREDRWVNKSERTNNWRESSAVGYTTK